MRRSSRGRCRPRPSSTCTARSPGQVAMETLWSCRTCMACVEICPVAVEHVPIIVQMRRKLVEDGAMDPLLTKTLQTIHKTGNSFGESKRKRGAWSKALPFKVKDARKEPVDVLWFVGDYASFDPRNQKVTQTFASPVARGRRGFRHSLRRRIERRQRRAPGRRGRAVRGAGRVPMSPRSRARPSKPSSPPIRTPTIRSATNIPTSAANTRSSTTPASSKQLFADGRLRSDAAAEAPHDIPRPLPSRALQQGL